MPITPLAFVLTLGVLIVVHEFGHYKVARWCGVKVLRFSVGFGRVLLRRVSRDGVEFTLALIPLGGYVRMLDSREGEVPADQAAQAFDRQPLRRRMAIVAAGPVANLLLAVLLYAGAGWIGTLEAEPVLAAPTAGSLAEGAGLQAGDRVQSFHVGEGDWQAARSLNDVRRALAQAVLDRQSIQLAVADAQGAHRRVVVLPVGQLEGAELDGPLIRRIGIGNAFSEPVLGRLEAGGPAEQAGLHEGDRVLTVDGRPVADAQSLRESIRGAGAHAPGTMQWLVERQGQRLSIAVTPRRVEDRDASGPIGRIDAYVGRAPAMVMVRLGSLEGLQQAFAQTWDTAWTSLRMLGRMLVGQASLKQLSGPLTIADYAGQSIQMGLVPYLAFLAMISVSLGVLNLLPLPMLDGGHLIYYVFEGVTGHPVPDHWQAWLQRGGAIVLLLMMSIALSNDVARLLGL
ncbi:RIP metalloprotease RseP [Ideonella oryzae]|uniref:Zinc metalloprotease n=1 Tax=Ideonella oryzae TaxID=2937441 RepID=A0ABT1BJV7_9BURK|nr:RIP metalloprotease RseP [Ideonella oryzae]MCO5976490.1 RIP metalloprotease RseP [Ideonella oryzae]